MTAVASRPRAVAGPGEATPGVGRCEAGLYEGVVRHRRISPVEHAFSYRVAMVHLDVDHVREALAVSPLASERPLRPLRFDRRDHLGDPTVDLGDEVRALVASETGLRPEGPVTMLAHLRTWGWCFNPITVYWCHDPDVPSRVVAQVLSVMNTPWKQRHAYVIEPGAGGAERRWTATFPKQLHVSPFFSMDLTYRLTSTAPGSAVSVVLDADRDGDHVFSASLAARRRPLDRRGVVRLLTRFPLMTHRVSAGIHHQALRLWRRRVPVVAHPDAAPVHLRSRRTA